jgi:hypothetical protein
MEVEVDIDVIEESFIAINKHSIKQEEIPKDITFSNIKSEPVEVSYVCVCLLLYTLINFFFPLFGGQGVGGSICSSWVGGHVIVEEICIYYYIHVEQNSYPPDVY